MPITARINPSHCHGSSASIGWLVFIGQVVQPQIVRREQVVSRVGSAQKPLHRSCRCFPIHRFGRFPEAWVKRYGCTYTWAGQREDRGKAKSTHHLVLFELAGPLQADL